MTVDEAAKQLRQWTDEEAGKDVEKVAKEMDDFIGELVRLRDSFQNTFLFGNYWFKTGIGLYAAFGLEIFSYLVADYPELLDDYLRIGNEVRLKIIRKSKRAGEFPAIFMCDDIASKNGPLFAPSFLRRHFYPYLEQMVDAYHQHGVKFMFHSDGNIMPVLDDLVAAGIDGLNPLETIAGVDIKEIRRRHPELVLIGGVDCSQLLPFGTPSEVKKATRQVMEAGAPWFFPGSSSEIHDNIPLDNVKAMVEAVHSFKL
jgi:uroporphyrinogen-III decarboxylase